MKRFYLSGQRTFENRGCEAIIRSTVAMLNQTFGQVEVLVPSTDAARDSHLWPEATEQGVRFVKTFVPRYTRYWAQSQRLPFKFLKQAGWPFPAPKDLHDQMESVDAVLSVGGDNYSLDYRLPSFLMGLDQLAMGLGKPVVLWGASVGPFEAEPYFVPTIRNHLARMTSIGVRETISYDYLTKMLGLTNVTQMADPAFTLAKAPVATTSFWPESRANGVIGVNVSPLIERYKRNGQDLRAETEQFIRDAVAKGFSVLLVPHVIYLGGAEKNNDAMYLEKILVRLKDLGAAVGMVPSTLDASQIKQVISQLRFFIGARTHSTIAALSSGVPTISIAYSVKAKGINRDLLGDHPVVLPTQALTAASLMAGLDYLTGHEAEIRAQLNEKLPQLRARVAEAAQGLKQAIEDHA